MRKTPLLVRLLEFYQRTLAPAEFESFAREVERLIDSKMQYLASFMPGVLRGREVQRLIDEQIDLNSEIKTSCQKGCGHCCHLEVEITRDDAEILAQSVLDKISIDRERLHELSLRDRQDVLWKIGVRPMNRCVFLGADNACRNYENRPAICRKHAVTSPVEECEKRDGNPSPLTIPMAEIIMSAAISFENNEFGALAIMLQKVLNEKEKYLHQNHSDLPTSANY